MNLEVVFFATKDVEMNINQRPRSVFLASSYSVLGVV